MENSTLKMACGAPGERKIKFGNDVTIRLNKATLTTTGDAPFSFEGVGKDVSTFKGILWVKDSTIDNFTGLSIRGVHALHLEDSRFTRLAGEINFNFVVPVQDLTVRGCLFEGKTGNEAVMFFGGDQFGELKPEPVGMDFVDCDFRKVDFRRQSAGPYYLCPEIKGGTANAVNCRFGMLGFDGTILRHKYYLDVLAVDKAGKPVEGATVIVVNEQDNEKDVRDIVMEAGLVENAAAKSKPDNARYPAENLMTGQKYIYVSAQASPAGKPYFVGQKNWFKGWAKVNVLHETKTGADGHTPPPRDAAKTLVIISLVQTTSSKPLVRTPDKETAYTYTVRVETADGRKGEVKGVKPDASWHRAKPNELQNTVKVMVR
ncbi:MAG: hypothetical protein L6455_02455, partial [Kiritimatiellae bacterium]|nr:hypothetical protein [Kiritimatiellia bacterium]